MGRHFNGTSDTAAWTIDLSALSAVTLAAWINFDNNTAPGQIVFEYTNAGGADGECFLGHLNATLQMNMGSPATNWNDTFGSVLIVPGQWGHYVMEWNRAAPTNKLWINGTAQTITASSHNPINVPFANSRWNFMSRAGTSIFNAGSLAEVGLWSGAVGATVAAIIGAGQCGASPLDVLYDSLLGYFPMWGDSPEYGYAGAGAGATITGTTVVDSSVGQTMGVITGQAGV